MAKISTHWSSRLAFILATASAAVGLGNIWRFPYIASQNGGGAFILVYIGFVIVLGVPLMMSEILVGRRGNQNAAASFRRLAIQNNHSRWWMIGGALPILTGFLILSYYTVITGWVLDFFVHSVVHIFKPHPIGELNQLFNNLLANPTKMFFWDTLIIAAIIFTLSRGVHKGIEKTVTIMFPAFIILIIVLIIYSMTTHYFIQSFNFLFKPNFKALTAHGILTALGQAFFSLGVGTGVMLTYGKYVSRDTPILQSCMMIAFIDTIIALAAGLAIFPIIFSNGLDLTSGPNLIFRTLPIGFSQLHFGNFFAALFFLMLFFAAFTSAIALLEPTILWLTEKYDISRVKAAIGAGLVLWVISLVTILSYNVAASIQLFNMTFAKLLEHFTSNIMLTLAGLLVAIFTGWFLYKQDTHEELQLPMNSNAYKSWRLVVRYIAPLGILMIFLNVMGVI